MDDYDEYIVYIRTDDRGVIIAINSSAFTDGIGWAEIDRGGGDRCHHAQGHYLPGNLMEEDGVYNFKLVDGYVEERTETEREDDRKLMAEKEKTRYATALEIGQAFLEALEEGR